MVTALKIVLVHLEPLASVGCVFLNAQEIQIAEMIIYVILPTFVFHLVLVILTVALVVIYLQASAAHVMNVGMAHVIRIRVRQGAVAQAIAVPARDVVTMIIVGTAIPTRTVARTAILATDVQVTKHAMMIMFAKQGVHAETVYAIQTRVREDAAVQATVVLVRAVVTKMSAGAAVLMHIAARAARIVMPVRAQKDAWIMLVREIVYHGQLKSGTAATAERKPEPVRVLIHGVLGVLVLARECVRQVLRRVVRAVCAEHKLEPVDLHVHGVLGAHVRMAIRTCMNQIILVAPNIRLV